MTTEQRFADAVKKKRVYEATKLTFIIISALCSMTLLIAMFLAMAQLQSVTDGTNRSVDILIDCTTPKGNCYQNGDRRSGAAVQSINKVSIYAAYCSKVPGNNTVKEIETCINNELEKEEKK